MVIHCKHCGVQVESKYSGTKYCEKCAKEIKRAKKNEQKRRARARESEAKRQDALNSGAIYQARNMTIKKSNLEEIVWKNSKKLKKMTLGELGAFAKENHVKYGELQVAMRKCGIG